MTCTFRRLSKSTNGTAAVEAAIFLPIFMLLSFGIVDLGQAMFVRQQANAAAQAGAIYAVTHSAPGATCETITGTCLSAIQTAMNDASGYPNFCTASVTFPPLSVPSPACTASMGVCAGAATTPPTKCVTVTAAYTLVPIISSAAYSWAQITPGLTYTVTIRIA